MRGSLFLGIDESFNLKFRIAQIGTRYISIYLLLSFFSTVYPIILISSKYCFRCYTCEISTFKPVHFYYCKMCFHVHILPVHTWEYMYMEALIATQFEKPPKSVFRGVLLTLKVQGRGGVYRLVISRRLHVSCSGV